MLALRALLSDTPLLVALLGARLLVAPTVVLVGLRQEEQVVAEEPTDHQMEPQRLVVTPRVTALAEAVAEVSLQVLERGVLVVTALVGL
jgi:hypothetical protein